MCGRTRMRFLMATSISSSIRFPCGSARTGPTARSPTTFLVGPVALAGQAPASPSIDQYAMEKMDEWLTNLTTGVSADPMMKKIVRAKPSDLVDSCYTASGERIVEHLTHRRQVQ